jgi:hypothetical protein
MGAWGASFGTAWGTSWNRAPAPPQVAVGGGPKWLPAGAAFFRPRPQSRDVVDHVRLVLRFRDEVSVNGRARSGEVGDERELLELVLAIDEFDQRDQAEAGRRQALQEMVDWWIRNRVTGARGRFGGFG